MFFNRRPGSYCAKPAWIQFGSGWLCQVLTKWIQSGNKLVCRNHRIRPTSGQCFWANPACLLGTHTVTTLHTHYKHTHNNLALLEFVTLEFLCNLILAMDYSFEVRSSNSLSSFKLGVGWGGGVNLYSRLCQIVGDEVRALEQQTDVTGMTALQGIVERHPAGILHEHQGTERNVHSPSRWSHMIIS